MLRIWMDRLLFQDNTDSEKVKICFAYSDRLVRISFAAGSPLSRFPFVQFLLIIISREDNNERYGYRSTYD